MSSSASISSILLSGLCAARRSGGARGATSRRRRRLPVQAERAAVRVRDVHWRVVHRLTVVIAVIVVVGAESVVVRGHHALLVLVRVAVVGVSVVEPRLA